MPGLVIWIGVATAVDAAYPFSCRMVLSSKPRHAIAQHGVALHNGFAALVLLLALARIRAAGIPAGGEIHHGDVIELISNGASAKSALLIFVGRSRSLSDRVFGSVASGLAHVAPVPVVIVP